MKCLKQSFFSHPEGCQYCQVHCWVYLEGPPSVQHGQNKGFCRMLQALEPWYEILGWKHLNEKELFQLFMIRQEGRWRMHSSLQRELCSPMMDGLQGPRSPWVPDNHCQYNDNEWEMHSYVLQTRGIHGSHNGANHHSEKCEHLWACWSVAAPKNEHAKHDFYFHICLLWRTFLHTNLLS